MVGSGVLTGVRLVIATGWLAGCGSPQAPVDHPTLDPAPHTAMPHGPFGAYAWRPRVDPFPAQFPPVQALRRDPRHGTAAQRVAIRRRGPVAQVLLGHHRQVLGTREFTVAVLVGRLEVLGEKRILRRLDPRQIAVIVPVELVEARVVRGLIRKRIAHGERQCAAADHKRFREFHAVLQSGERA